MQINAPSEITHSDNGNQELIPVDRDRFQILPVKQPCQLQEFIDTCGLTFEPGCTFFEFSHKTEDISSDREVILMTKVCNKNHISPLIASFTITLLR